MQKRFPLRDGLGKFKEVVSLVVLLTTTSPSCVGLITTLPINGVAVAKWVKSKSIAPLWGNGIEVRARSLPGAIAFLPPLGAIVITCSANPDVLVVRDSTGVAAGLFS